MTEQDRFHIDKGSFRYYQGNPLCVDMNKTQGAVIEILYESFNLARAKLGEHETPISRDNNAGHRQTLSGDSRS